MQDSHSCDPGSIPGRRILLKILLSSYTSLFIFLFFLPTIWLALLFNISITIVFFCLSLYEGFLTARQPYQIVLAEKWNQKKIRVQCHRQFSHLNRFLRFHLTRFGANICLFFLIELSILNWISPISARGNIHSAISCSYFDGMKKGAKWRNLKFR